LNKIEENVNNNKNINTDENNNSTNNTELNDYGRDATRILLDFKKIRISKFFCLINNNVSLKLFLK